MEKLIRRVALLVGPLLVVAGIMQARDHSAAQQTGPVAAPGVFVPFTAESEITTAAGTTVLGRFYRRSDGSTRSETGERLDAPSLIVINDYTAHVTYSWRAHDGHWVAHPLDAPAPLPWQPDSSSLASMKSVAEVVDGLELLRKENPGARGGYSLVAPRLNYYPVVIRTCPDGEAGCVTSRKRRITIGEPPDALFEPGAQERVVESNVPFVRRPDAR